MSKILGKATSHLVMFLVGWISFFAGGIVESATVQMLLLAVARVLP